MNLKKYLFTSSFVTTIAIIFVLLIAAGCAVILEKQANLQKQNQIDRITSVNNSISSAANSLASYDRYYWGGGQKITLMQAGGKVSLVTDGLVTLAEIKNKLSKYSGVRSIESGGPNYFIITYTSQDIGNLILDLRREIYVKTADVVLYTTNETQPLVLTNRINTAVKPDKEADFLEEINSYPVRIVSRSFWPASSNYAGSLEYVLEVDYKKTASNSLNLANKLYDTGLVRWSQPIFIIEPKLQRTATSDASTGSTLLTSCLNEWKTTYTNFDVTEPDEFKKLYKPGWITVQFKQGTQESDARGLIAKAGLSLVNYDNLILPSALVSVPVGKELESVCNLRALQSPLVGAVEPQMLPPPLP